MLAIVPARGGSKGVPRKNRRIVAGRPLIAYTLDAAKAATSLARIVVSTDDPEIAAIAAAEGVEVVMRPADIAGDASPVIDAVRHVLADLAARDGFDPDGVVLLQPTSPFRSGADIDAAVAVFARNACTPVCSVYQVEDAHPARMYRIEGERLVSLTPELASVRRQDLPPVYHRNGSVYVFGRREIASGAIIGPDMAPFVMGPESSVNVDTEIDLLLVGAILERSDADPDPRA